METDAEILRSSLPTELWARATALAAEDAAKEIDTMGRAQALLEEGQFLLRSAATDRGLALLVASLIVQSSQGRLDPITVTARLLEVLEYLDDPHLRLCLSSRGSLPKDHALYAQLQFARLHAKAQSCVDRTQYSEALAVIDDLLKLMLGGASTIAHDSPSIRAYYNARHFRASVLVGKGEVAVAGYELAELALGLQHANRPDLKELGHRFGRSLVAIADRSASPSSSTGGTLQLRIPSSVPALFARGASSSFILPLLPLPIVVVGALFASFPQVTPPFRWYCGLVAGFAFLLAVGLAFWRYLSSSLTSSINVTDSGIEVVKIRGGDTLCHLPWNEIVSIAFVGRRASDEPCLIVPLGENKGDVRFGIGGLHQTGLKCMCQRGQVGAVIVPAPAARLPLFILVDVLVRRARPREEVLPAGAPVESRLRCCDRPDLETTKSLNSDRHGTCAVRRCRTCGQLWLYRYDEWVDFSGPDRSTIWYSPMSQEEHALIETEGSEHGLVERKHDRTVYVFERSDDRPETIVKVISGMPERFW